MTNGIQGFYDYNYTPSNISGTNTSTANGAIPATSSIHNPLAPSGQVEPKGECQTCKSRKYQDGSNENVSFKAATHISPEMASGAVRAHEGEHVSNAYTKASQNNGKVINASVSIHTSICPECGRTYVSGGLTSTTIKYANESNPYVRNLKAQQSDSLKGNNINYEA